MLLGKKSVQKAQSDWAVILNRAATEFSKQRAMDQLTAVFHLSPEEAGDLVNNTPIVLLDNIPFETAEKIKGRFSNAGADCQVTNAVMTKRKCFRAVWPETPDLAAVIGEDLDARRQAEKLSAATSTSSDETADDFPLPSQAAVSPLSVDLEHNTRNIPEKNTGEAFHLLHEEQALKQLTLELQRENETLRRQLDQIEQSSRSKSREAEQFNTRLEQFQNEQERLDGLAGRLREENTRLTSRVKELERELDRTRQDSILAKNTGQPELAESKAQLEHLRSEYARTQNMLRTVQNEAKQFQQEWTQAQKALSETRAECEDLKRMLDQAQMNSVQLKEEMDRTRCETEEHMRAQGLELDEWKRKANEWSASYSKLIKENEFLRGHQTEELENLRSRTKELTGELEQARAQNRDFVTQLEQQALVQKKMKALQEISEKEIHLKELVQKQQRIEQEIREREEDMKSILMAQEESEREIVKLKQSQKYLAEQAKMKDRSRFTRSRASNPSVMPPQDPDNLESS